TAPARRPRSTSRASQGGAAPDRAGTNEPALGPGAAPQSRWFLSGGGRRSIRQVDVLFLLPCLHGDFQPGLLPVGVLPRDLDVDPSAGGPPGALGLGALRAYPGRAAPRPTRPAPGAAVHRRLLVRVERFRLDRHVQLPGGKLRRGEGAFGADGGRVRGVT